MQKTNKMNNQGTKSRIRVLVLGTGFFGRNWLREISASPECEVAGVVGKSPDFLTAVGEEFKIPESRRYFNIEDGLDRSQAQAVIVALPEMVHKNAIVAALEHGMHVLTEKPLAMSIAEAGEIIRASRKAAGPVVMVDQNYRWHPQTQTLRRAIKEGRIGKIASLSYIFRQSIQRTTRDGWREQMTHPYLIDVSVHHFDLLRALTGLECLKIVANGVRPTWSWIKGVPAVDSMMIFEQDVSVTYSGTMVGRGLLTPQDGIITVIGEKGMLQMEADSQVRLYQDKDVETIPQVTMQITDMSYALQEFLACIQEGRKPETHVEDNIHSLAIVEAAISSVETGKWFEVAPLVKEALG